MSLDLKALLPTMLIWRILARSPSLMSILTRTRLFGQVLHLGVDRHGVLAAAVVLVGEVLRHLFQCRAVEGLSGRQAHVAQRLLQVLGLDVLVALDLDALERRALEHGDQQGIAVAIQRDIAEESRGVQRPQRLAQPLCVELVADVDRQVIEHRAFGDALQALDLDVADGKIAVARLLPERSCAGHKQNKRRDDRAKTHAHTAVTKEEIQPN